MNIDSILLRSWFGVFLLLLPLAGCERAQTPATQSAKPTANTESPVTPADATEGVDEAIVREAPAEWSAFEKWVIKEIQAIRETVPLPTDPTLAQPHNPCTRLEPIVAMANINSTWSGDQEEAKPILTLGPFRSDQNSPQFKAEKAFDRQFGWGCQMAVTGFEIDAGKIGRISIRLRAPAGKHIDLRWAEDGFARLPIPDNRQIWPLELDTNGLTRWEGTIRNMLVRTDGFAEDGVVEIESIQFWSRENVFPKPVGRGSYSIDTLRRYTIYAHSPAEIRFPNFTVPQDGKFTASLAAVFPDRLMETADAGGATTHFTVMVESDGESKTVLDREIPVGALWEETSISLAQWSGRKIAFTLKSWSDDERVVALWGNPTIYQPVTDPPIMILYLIDAFAAKHASLYGYSRPTTPTLEKLAADGVWFANNYANSPVTITSVPNTQLSMPAERHGVFHSSIYAPLELISIADAMSAAGFATASFITNANAGARQNMDQGFDEYSPYAMFHTLERTSADRTVPIDEVLDWFERHRDRPTFAYIHTCEPHAPYSPPPGYAGHFDPDYTGGIDGTLDAHHGYFAAKSQRDIEHIRALYDEECLFADEQLGRFLQRMHDAGFGPRVNLFVIADHGEELQEHGHWGHGEGLYDEVLRVPFVTHGPLVTARGRQNIPSNLYDIMPTILDLFGMPQPYPMQGVSLKSLLQKDAGAPPAELSPQRTLIVSHHRYRGRNQIEYAVIEANRWKLHYRYMWDDQPAYPDPARFELYDLQADPEEKHNLIDQHHDIARRLMCKLVGYAQKQHPYPSQQEGLLFDPEQLENLKAGNYIDDDAPDSAPPATPPTETSPRSEGPHP